MTAFTTKITAVAAAIAVAAGGTLALSAAKADAAVRDAGAGIAATAEASRTADGTITFRGERYQLSERAVVSTTPTTIRIADDAARTKGGATTSFYAQLGYSFDASKPSVIRVSSGTVIRGYDFATGAYAPDQAVRLGESALSLDSPHWSQATHMWGHLNSTTERGVELDIHGVHFGFPS